MTEYNGTDDGSTVSFAQSGDLTRPTHLGVVDFPDFTGAVVWFINRGRNDGSGPAFAYWLSPDGIDLIGAYYDGGVPFGQLSDIVGAGTFTA